MYCYSFDEIDWEGPFQSLFELVETAKENKDESDRVIYIAPCNMVAEEFEDIFAGVNVEIAIEDILEQVIENCKSQNILNYEELERLNISEITLNLEKSITEAVVNSTDLYIADMTEKVSYII
jgi:hypothetical protein